MARYLYLLLLPFALMGCGTKPPEGSHVHGMVRYQGQPLAGGLIVFTPDMDRGTDGPIARAIIDTEGKYVLLCNERPTIPPGWYRIAIAGPPTSSDHPLAHPPRRYRNPDLSGLVREIKAGSENVFDFHLDDS